MIKYFKYFIYLFVFIGFSTSNAGSYDDFFKAIHFDRPEDIQKLVARGFDTNTPNEKGVPALLWAIKSGSPKSAMYLASQAQTRVEVVNEAGETPLMLAAITNQLELANQLIERGAEVNRKGWTPLHYAATKGHIEMMRLLIDNHAYLDAESPNGTTPLMMAAHYGTAMATTSACASAVCRSLLACNASGKAAAPRYAELVCCALISSASSARRDHNMVCALCEASAAMVVPHEPAPTTHTRCFTS